MESHMFYSFDADTDSGNVDKSLPTEQHNLSWYVNTEIPALPE